MVQSILLTGFSGRIGSALSRLLDEIVSEHDEIFVLQNKTIFPENLTDRATVVNSETLENRRYDLAIHLAAITDTNFCRKPENRELVHFVNVGLTARICNIAQRVLTISTDNVFRGEPNAPDYKETDKTNPCNYYGETKAAAEQIVLAHSGAIVRIQTLLGAPNRIIDKVIDEILGRPNKYYPLWTDTISRPANFEDLVKVLQKLTLGDQSGIYHLSCSGLPLSRAQMGERVLEIYKSAGLPTKIDKMASEPCSIPEFPRRLVLDTEKTQAELGIAFASVKDALKTHVLEYLQARI